MGDPGRRSVEMAVRFIDLRVLGLRVLGLWCILILEYMVDTVYVMVWFRFIWLHCI